MAEIKFANNCLLEISPITDQSFAFGECNIKESILGELPELTLTVRTDKDLCKVNDKITGSLKNEKGNVTNFKGYVYSISYAQNNCIIKILCVEPDFLKKERVSKFDSVYDTIQALYPGEIESNTQADLSKKAVDIFQKSITNYNLIKKCLLGYKKNTIYGFALGDLRINDLSNWKPKMEVESLVNIQPIDLSTLADPKTYSKEVEVIDYSKGKDPHHKIIKFYDKLIPVNKDYEILFSNILYNSRFKTTKNITNYNTRELFPLNITDSVEVIDHSKTIKKCFISSREINFDAQKLEVSYTIQSIDPL